MLVKLTFPNHEGETDLSQYTGNQSGVFGSVEFRINDNTHEADAWFVFEDVSKLDSWCVVPPNQVHYVAAETGWSPDKFLRPGRDRFYNQFASVNSPYPIAGVNVSNTAPFLPWMVNSSGGRYFFPHERDIKFFRGLDGVKKTFPLSVICSTQNWSPNHRLRLAFVEYLKKYFGEDLHWFGKGVREIAEKWDGLHQYERTIVLENQTFGWGYSEKILDAYLCLSEPIYSGGTNVQGALPLEKRQLIDLMDFEGSAKRIKEILRNRVNAEAMDRVIVGKKSVLRELHFLNRLSRIAKKVAAGSSRAERSLVKLKSREEAEIANGETDGKKISRFLLRIKQ